MSNLLGYRLKQVLAGLLILVMGALVVNKAIYTHVHLTPEGSMQAHAHPFSKSSEGQSGTSHQHSALEHFLLDHLDVLMIFVWAVLVLRQLSSNSSLKEPASYLLLPAFIPRTPGRAPPLCM